MKKSSKKNILNIEFDDFTIEQLLRELTSGILITPNVDIIMKAQKDIEFYHRIQEAEYTICDSRIITIISRLLGVPLKETISGSNFFHSYYMYHKENESVKIFLLGSTGNIAQIAMNRINKQVGRKIVIDAFSPSMGFNNKIDENKFIIDRINNSKATVLVIGVGSPRQEKWIAALRKEFKHIKLFMCLGATIDFEAGVKKRAPLIFQKFALEWLYRMCQEPCRLIRRYFIDDTPFFWLVLKQKLGVYRNPFSK